MKPQRVGILVNSWPSPEFPPGGTGRHARDLASLLVAAGREVSVLISVPDGTWITKARRVASATVSDVAVAADPRWTYRAHYRSVPGEMSLVEWLRDHNFDLVHIVHPGEAGIVAAARVALEGTPVVLDAADAQLACHMGHLVNPLIKRPICELPVDARTCADCMAAGTGLSGDFMLALQEERRTLALASVAAGPVLTDSAYIKDQLQRSMPADLRYVPWPVTSAPSLTPAIRRKGTLRVGFFGSPTWRKGLDVLVEAFAEIHNAQLFVFAPEDDPYDTKWARMVRERARTVPAIVWKGPYAPEQVFELMQTVDVVAVPSRAESLPGVLKEALAAGRSVIASRVAGIPELVQEDSGWLLPPEDAGAWRNTISWLASERGPLLERVPRPDLQSEERFLRQVLDVYEERMDASVQRNDVLRMLGEAAKVRERHTYLRSDERYQRALVELRRGSRVRALSGLARSALGSNPARWGPIATWILRSGAGYDSAARAVLWAERSGHAPGRIWSARHWFQAWKRSDPRS